MKNNKSNKGGRPSKLNKEWLDAFEKVINSDGNAIILTDSELLLLTNEQLEEDQKICQSTFEKWKAGKNNEATHSQFLRLYKKALIIQKKALFAKMEHEDQKNWQKYAWIIERKFDEWNMRKKFETNVKAEVSQITGMEIL